VTGRTFSGSGPLYINVSPYLAARARFLPPSARGIPPEKPLDPAENTPVYVGYGHHHHSTGRTAKTSGRRGAEALVGIFQQYGEANKEDVIRASKDSFEKALLQTESRLEIALTQTKGDLEGKIAQTKGDLEAKMAHMELRIEGKLGDIKAEIGSVRAEMADVKGSLRAEMGQMEGRLESKIAQTVAQSQSTLIKWLFSLTMAQTTAVIIAILLK